MAVELFQLIASVALDTKGFSRNVESATREGEQLAKELAAIGVEAVKTAAKFEVVENALTATAGSSRLAQNELAALNNLARNTVGLRLESAEAGYLRLRNLGFQAETTRNLIAGLSKQKLLSGVDAQSIDRVIVNFTQLSASTNRVGQDIKEIVHALPTMRKVFQDAFGTVDPQKLKNLIDKDTQGFFQKLAEQMAKTKTAAGGFDNALGKLADSYTNAEREFAKPILKPLTRFLETLTVSLRDNKSVFREWGESAGNVLNALSALADSKLTYLIAKTAEYSARIFSFGLLDSAEGLGREKSKWDRFFDNIEPSDSQLESYYEKIEEKEELAARKKQEIEAKKAREVERINDESRKRIDSQQKAGLSGIENAYKLHTTQIKSTIADSYAEQVKQQSQLYASEQNYLRQRYALTAKFYRDKYNLAQDDNDKFKIQQEATVELGGLKYQYQSNIAEATRKAQELARQEIERQRNTRTEKISIQISGVQSERDSNLFSFDKQLEKQQISFEEFRNESVAIVNDTYKKLANLASQNLAEELSRVGIQEDEKENIKLRYAQAEIQRNQAQKRSIDEIEDKTQKETLRRLEQNLSRQSELHQQYIGQVQTRFQLLSVYTSNYSLDIAKSIEGINGEIANLLDKGVSAKDFRVQGLGAISSVLATSMSKPLEKMELDILNVQNSLQEKMFAQRRTGLLEALNQAKANGTALGEIEHNLTLLTSEEAQARFNYLLNYAQKYSQTLESLKTEVEAMRLGNSRAVIETDRNAEKSVLQQEKSAYQEIANLKAYIANIDTFSKLDIEAAQLQQIIALRQAENAQIISGNVSMQYRLQMMAAQLPTVSTALKDSYANAIDGMSGVLSQSLANFDGSFKNLFAGIGQGFKQLTSQIISDLLRILIYKAIFKLLAAFSGGGSFGADTGGATMSSGWFSGNGGGIGMAAGGLVSGGKKGVDSVPAMLMPDEYVNTANSVKYYGAGLFEALNQKLLPKDFFSYRKFSDGGLGSDAIVNPVSPSIPSLSTNTVNNNNRQVIVNINQTNNQNGLNKSQSFPYSANQQARMLADVIVKEINRK